jgi:hypothetical protein
MDADSGRKPPSSGTRSTRSGPENTYIEDREIGEDGTHFLIKRILGKFHFSHVEIANATDFKVLVDDLENLR